VPFVSIFAAFSRKSLAYEISLKQSAMKKAYIRSSLLWACFMFKSASKFFCALPMFFEMVLDSFSRRSQFAVFSAFQNYTYACVAIVCAYCAADI
jgi:hypothetical protein